MTASTTLAPPAAHPRILERREAVEDENLRSRNRRLIAVGVLVVIGLLGFAATRSPLLDVDEVRVIGAAHSGPNNLRSIAGIEPGTPLVGLDLHRAEQNLLALPSVAAVSSQRSWGGVITIDVLERDPVARLNTTDGVVIAAADGTVLEITQDPDSSLPLISGAMFQTRVGASLPLELQESLAVAAALPSDIGRVTNKVELTIDDIELRLVGGGTVSLGDARQLDAKFDTVRSFLGQVNLRCLKMINVQAPLVPVLERQC